MPSPLWKDRSGRLPGTALSITSSRLSCGSLPKRRTLSGLAGSCACKFMGRDVGEGVRRGRRLSPTSWAEHLIVSGVPGACDPQALLSHLRITGGHGGPPLQLFSTISRRDCRVVRSRAA